MSPTGEVSETPALDWLFSLQRFGVKPGLERTHALLGRLALPADGTRTVLVAGTNGKGTVTRLISAALNADGRVTGSFFSPHLERVGERARVGGQEATTDEMEAAVATVRPHAEELGCTFFEVVTAAALERFRSAGVEWAVMEVGMGGRYDATNALDPDLSVITSVALDHQTVLGPTVRSIAAEKAGILRPGRPVVTGAAGDALGEIAAEAARQGSPLRAYGTDFEARVGHSSWDGLHVTVDAVGNHIAGLPLALTSPLVGRHQARNLAVAAVAALELGVAPEVVKAAFAVTDWPGRLERFDLDRCWVLDGAHNPEASGALSDSLTDLGAKPDVVVVGVSADKDVSGVLGPLADLGSRVVATKASTSPRALQPATVASLVRTLGGEDVREAGTAEEAIEMARSLTEPGDLVLVAGTLFLVGEVRSLIRNERPEARERWQ